jgi:cytochrome c peroxidase
VTNRVEMRGKPGDRDVHGNVNELANLPDDAFTLIWSGVMKRLLSIDGYVQKFSAAFPGVPPNQLGFQHAANAIAAFETQAFAKTNSAFDRYLARNDNALTVEQKRGALLFFGRARCSSCHSGALLGAQQFANVGAPQVGPGAGRMMPLDAGREDNFMGAQARFFFRVPPLRNVELTAPYTHAGAYKTLEAVVRHYNDVEKAIKEYDVSQLDPDVRSSYHGDAATISTLLSTVDHRVRLPLKLTEDEQRQLVAFLKSLTDPAAKDLAHVIPSSVPSGLPVR